MKQSTQGAKHFSEIVNTARELTTEIKDTDLRRVAIVRLTNELLTYQIAKPMVSVRIF
jgi:hypothetical protein